MKNRLSEAALAFFREQGAKGGKIGGKARLKKLTAEKRSEIARKAAAASAEVRSKKAKEKAVTK